MQLLENAADTLCIYAQLSKQRNVGIRFYICKNIDMYNNVIKCYIILTQLVGKIGRLKLSKFCIK